MLLLLCWIALGAQASQADHWGSCFLPDSPQCETGTAAQREALWPETEAELADICSSLFGSHAGTETHNYGELGSLSGRSYLKSICAPGSDLRRHYLKEVQCINRQNISYCDSAQFQADNCQFSRDACVAIILNSNCGVEASHLHQNLKLIFHLNLDAHGKSQCSRNNFCEHVSSSEDIVIKPADPQIVHESSTVDVHEQHTFKVVYPQDLGSLETIKCTRLKNDSIHAGSFRCVVSYVENNGAPGTFSTVQNNFNHMSTENGVKIDSTGESQGISHDLETDQKIVDCSPQRLQNFQRVAIDRICKTVVPEPDIALVSEAIRLDLNDGEIHGVASNPAELNDFDEISTSSEVILLPYEENEIMYHNNDEIQNQIVDAVPGDEIVMVGKFDEQYEMVEIEDHTYQYMSPNNNFELAEKLESAVAELAEELESAAAEEAEDIEAAVSENAEELLSALADEIEKIESSESEDAEEIESAVVEDAEELESAVDEDEKLETAVAEDSEELELALAEYIKELKYAVSGDAMETESPVAEDAEQIESAVAEEMEEIESDVAEDINGLSSAVSEEDASVIESTSAEYIEMLETAESEAAEEIESAVAENADEIESVVLEDIEELEPAVAEPVQELKSFVAEDSQEIDSTVAEDAQELEPASTNVAVEPELAVAEDADEIESEVFQSAKDLKSTTTYIAPEIKYLTTEDVPEIESLVAENTEKLNLAVVEDAPNSEALVVGYAVLIESAVPEENNEVKPLVAGHAENFEPAVAEDVLDSQYFEAEDAPALESVIGKDSKEFDSVVDENTEEVESTIVEIAEKLALAVAELGEDFSSASVAAPEEDASVAASAASEDLASGGAEDAEDLATAVAEDAEDLSTAVADDAEDLASAVAEDAEDLASAVAEDAEDLASAVAEDAEDLASAVAEDAEDLASAVAEDAEDLASAVAEDAEDLASAVAEDDENLASTVAEDAEDLSSTVAEDAKDLALATHAVAKELELHVDTEAKVLPSAVAMDVLELESATAEEVPEIINGNIEVKSLDSNYIQLNEAPDDIYILDILEEVKDDGAKIPHLSEMEKTPILDEISELVGAQMQLFELVETDSSEKFYDLQHDGSLNILSSNEVHKKVSQMKDKVHEQMKPDTLKNANSLKSITSEENPTVNEQGEVEDIKDSEINLLRTGDASPEEESVHDRSALAKDKVIFEDDNYETHESESSLGAHLKNFSAMIVNDVLSVFNRNPTATA